MYLSGADNNFNRVWLKNNGFCSNAYPTTARLSQQQFKAILGELGRAKQTCKMLLSINPEHVEKILNGKKQYEFRKVRCKPDVDKIVIYSTTPQKMVVAEAEIDEIIEDDIIEVWRRTKALAGISHDFFMAYYKGKKKAGSIQTGKR